MPFISKIEEEIKQTKTPTQIKEEYKQDQAIKNFLYGAGRDGWTEEYYNRILECSKSNLLVIDGVRPQKNEEGKYIYKIDEEGSEFHKRLSAVYFILAQNKAEKDLTDDERVILDILAHPLTIIKKKEEDLKKEMVVTAYKWHQLTDFRHIDEVKEHHPELYNRWEEKEMIPQGKISKEWEEVF